MEAQAEVMEEEKGRKLKIARLMSRPNAYTNCTATVGLGWILFSAVSNVIYSRPSLLCYKPLVYNGYFDYVIDII